MKVDCIIPESRHGRDAVYWKKSLPFAVNPRGVLIHRVKYAISFRNYDGSISHESAHYWCNNFGRVKFFADPPQDKMLCTFCEARAVAAGQLPADQLAGRHVHIGRAKAVQLCCLTNQIH